MKTNIRFGYGVNGYFLIWEEDGKRYSVYFFQNGLWQEYISFKMGKRFFKSKLSEIERILTAVGNGETTA